jgi:hypothetical protein
MIFLLDTFPIMATHSSLQVGKKIGSYNTSKAKEWKPLMDSLAGVRGEKLTTPAAFKKLLKEGQINKGEMRFGSGKV